MTLIANIKRELMTSPRSFPEYSVVASFGNNYLNIQRDTWSTRGLVILNKWKSHIRFPKTQGKLVCVQKAGVGLLTTINSKILGWGEQAVWGGRNY